VICRHAHDDNERQLTAYSTDVGPSSFFKNSTSAPAGALRTNHDDLRVKRGKAGKHNGPVGKLGRLCRSVKNLGGGNWWERLKVAGWREGNGSAGAEDSIVERNGRQRLTGPVRVEVVRSIQVARQTSALRSCCS